MRERAEKQEEERVARGEAPSEKGPQWRPGVAYEGKQLATSHNFHKGVDVFAEPDKVTADNVLYWRTLRSPIYDGCIIIERIFVPPTFQSRQGLEVLCVCRSSEGF